MGSSTASDEDRVGAKESLHNCPRAEGRFSRIICAACAELDGLAVICFEETRTGKAGDRDCWVHVLRFRINLHICP